MRRRESHPFLDPNLDIRYLDKGSITHVYDIVSPPPEIEGNIDEKKYVIKQYPNDIALEKCLYGLEDPSTLTWHEKAKILKEREDRLRSFFSDTMPDFVLPSTFIIGTGFSGDTRIFQIQKKIDDGEDINYLQTEDDFKEYCRDKSDAFREVLLHDLRALEKKWKELMDDPYYRTHIPDIGRHNFFVLKNGHLLLFDTNRQFFPKQESLWKANWEKIKNSADIVFEALPRVLKEVIRETNKNTHK